MTPETLKLPQQTEGNKWKKISQEIDKLDPIQIDRLIPFIHKLNREKNVQALAEILYKHLPYPERLERFTYNESIACMRDIGIFLGSLKKHGTEPVEVIPELDYVLDVLSDKTNLPPRDTLFHYTIWNPSGLRVRTYTGLSDEIHLIESVKMSMFPLVDAIYNLIELHQTPLNSPAFEEICNIAEENLSGMINGIVYAKRNVSPAVFANELRFYFDPISLYRREFIGPGAVEMPLFVFDHLLWSSETNDEEYVKFKITYLPFNQPDIRDIYYNYDNQPSLATKVIEALKKNPGYCQQTAKSARALLSLCNRLKSFRMPHKKLAEESYAQQKERSHGSGGYSTDILSHIISLNLKTIADIEQAITRYGR
ncbi:sensor signal transduction histidine kinase [Sporocytophaga myxococcoides]|uniref:Sensor signal transduction histidine kinase n=1 Tax=Sporocytophaga myxococcoides TaxID=153721 RepID=A0A098L8S6_9BACT|nr:monodechloroaminopyrrolnitrin synthase PrnB family protein [Sporocytophaga myxococcoides]GAL82952.1 sensor signal transduction histidine kinase [Sporocytophaga myxococcoides]